MEEIADAYKGLGLLMPVLIVKAPNGVMSRICVRFIKFWIIYRNRWSCRIIINWPMTFYSVTPSTKNQLIIDLELDSENYLHVPYIPYPGIDNPFANCRENTITWFNKAIYQIEHRQFDDFGAGASKLYCDSEVRVDNTCMPLGKYTETHQRKMGISVGSESRTFRAVCLAGHDPCTPDYCREFDNEHQYLPSIPKRWRNTA